MTTKNSVAITELILYTDPKTKTLGKIYKPFFGNTESELTAYLQYYCGKYGILEAKTISKEEYESITKIQKQQKP